jgi:hypothetical protein
MYCPNLQCPDFLQRGIHGEYREGFTVCPECDSLLMTESPEPAWGEDPILGTLIPVAAYSYRHEADLAASMLLANGIQAVVAGDDCGSVDPALGFATRTRVIVEASQAATASALLEEAEPAGEVGVDLA